MKFRTQSMNEENEITSIGNTMERGTCAPSADLFELNVGTWSSIKHVLGKGIDVSGLPSYLNHIYVLKKLRTSD